jgi:hypothetical protein
VRRPRSTRQVCPLSVRCVDGQRYRDGRADAPLHRPMRRSATRTPHPMRRVRATTATSTPSAACSGSKACGSPSPGRSTDTGARGERPAPPHRSGAAVLWGWALTRRRACPAQPRAWARSARRDERGVRALRQVNRRSTRQATLSAARCCRDGFRARLRYCDRGPSRSSRSDTPRHWRCDPGTRAGHDRCHPETDAPR